MSYKEFVKKVIARSKQPLPENASYEYEARFLNFDRESFNVLLQKLKDMSNNPQKKDWKPFKETSQHDFVIDGRRYTTIPGTSNLNMMDKIGVMMMKENNIKFALSQEREEGISEDIMYINDEIQFLGQPKKIEMKREKNRTTFEVKKIKIDMTEVVENGNVKYEVELEIEPKFLKSNEALFDQLIKIINGFMPNYEEIIKFYNESMTSGKKIQKEDLIFGTVSRARDLKIEDITTGGILKNYDVSVKADGEQRFLVAHKTGLWLLYPKNIITRLGDLPDDMQENTIISGELISKDNIKSNIMIDSEYIFVPFDAQIIRGESVMKKNYEQRRKMMMTVLRDKTYIKAKGVNKLYIVMKKYFKIDSVDTFYKSMKDALNERENVIYKEDGLVITPIKSSYVTSGSSKPFNQRNLGNYPDVCKWKPVEKLTIDFLYQSEYGENIIITKDKDVVDFKTKPISSKFKFINLEKLKTKSGSIVEFKPVEVKDGIVVLEPDRLRPDKIFPNDYYIVENLYNLLMNPITVGTLLGENTVLMRKFHNKLKGEILTDVTKDSYLIDIGSGKGGDINKIKKFKRVLAIEPNVSYIHEMERRLKEREMEDKVDILNARGEDTDTIVENVETFLPEDLEGKKVYISFMFSLGFFWESDKTLQSLADTINKINDVVTERDGDKCEILFITLDGKRLKLILERFNESKTKGVENVSLNTINIFHKEGEHDLQISIRDSKTVIDTQTEYFVYINQLFEKINYICPRVIYASNESGKMIMSEGEKIYNSLINYGRAVYTTEKIVDTPDTRLPVSSDEGIEKEGKRYFKGDDELQTMPFIGKRIFRVATIDNGVSLLHSVLKLISRDYIEEDANERHERCDRFIKELNYNLSIDNISLTTGYKIDVIEGTSKKSYGKGDKRIFVFLNKDGTFEPLVKKLDNGTYCSVFE